MLMEPYEIKTCCICLCELDNSNHLQCKRCNEGTVCKSCRREMDALPKCPICSRISVVTDKWYDPNKLSSPVSNESIVVIDMDMIYQNEDDDIVEIGLCARFTVTLYSLCGFLIGCFFFGWFLEITFLDDPITFEEDNTDKQNIRIILTTTLTGFIGCLIVGFLISLCICDNTPQHRRENNHVIEHNRMVID